MFLVLVVGVLVGTFTSSLLVQAPFRASDFLSALVLSPFEMTFGIPILFKFYSAFWSVPVFCGLLLTISSLGWARQRSGSRPLVGLFVGSTLWSVGNLPIFYAFMSV